MPVSSKCRCKDPEKHLLCDGYVQQEQPKWLVNCTCPCHIRESYQLPSGGWGSKWTHDLSKLPRYRKSKKGAP
jgi:hypothetical protein